MGFQRVDQFPGSRAIKPKAFKEFQLPRVVRINQLTRVYLCIPRTTAAGYVDARLPLGWNGSNRRKPVR
jgi:hypothetical protein